MIKEFYEDQFTVEAKLDENGKAYCEGWHPGMDLSLEGLKKTNWLKHLDPEKNGNFLKMLEPVHMNKRIAVVDAAILKCLKSNG